MFCYLAGLFSQWCGALQFFFPFLLCLKQGSDFNIETPPSSRNQVTTSGNNKNWTFLTGHI